MRHAMTPIAPIKRALMSKEMDKDFRINNFNQSIT
jgi:hypothetical protein